MITDDLDPDSNAADSDSTDAVPPQKGRGRGAGLSWPQIFSDTRAKVIGILIFAATVLPLAQLGWQWLGGALSARGEDRSILSEVRAGVTLDYLRDKLQAEPVAVLGDGEVDYLGAQRPIKDHLFLLDLAYVEAFVDDETNMVLAYAITMRGSQLSGPLEDAPEGVRLGKSSLVDVFPQGPDLLAGACGVHISAWYEISGNSNAEGARRTAFGSTDAGIQEAGVPDVGCFPDSTEALSQGVLFASPPADHPLYAPDIFRPTPQYRQSRVRADVVINAMVVTAPAVEITPMMVSLHPDVASLYTD